METILDLTIETGEYKPAPDCQGAPISDNEALENIRKSQFFDIPLFKRRSKRTDTVVYVGAGPSMSEYIEEIREKKQNGQYIITSNLTYDWLVERGIIADAVLVIDPKEKVSRYIKNPQKETEFFIAVVCNEGVIKGLLEKGVKVEKLLVGYGMENEKDIELQKEIYGEGNDFLVGGTMTGLRIMNFALMLGFKTIEIYGVDSCYGKEAPELIPEEDSRYFDAVISNEEAFYEDPKTGKRYAIHLPDNGGWFYAYKKKHHGAIQIARCPDGRTFWTSPVFAHQAKQFVKWYDRFEDKLKIIVHGDNLTNHLLKCHLKNIEQRRKKVGGKILSDKYRPIFKEFFKNDNHIVYYDIVNNAIDKGAVALSKALNRTVTVMNYDRILIDDECPTKHDITHTTNILEHIEVECVDNLLKDLKELTRYMAIIHIDLSDSKAQLSDGRDAHITQKSPQWWTNRIESYFDIVEGVWHGGVNALFVCQSLNAKDNLKEENAT